MSAEVLTGWRDRPLEDVLALARTVLEDPGFPTVRRWRAAGGKVLGHFQVYFPEEIAHAAGLLPVKIHGAPIEARQAEARFGSYLCSIVKTSLELALSGRLELDLFVAPPICDAARNLAAIWGRNLTYPCGTLYLPQNVTSGHAARYLRAEYERLSLIVAEVAGGPVTWPALQRSIDVFNENRRLVRGLYALRRESPWLLAADETYVLMAVGGRIPREEHNALLAAAIRLIEARPGRPQDRIRVVFEGGFCEQPPLDLIRLIAESTYVVDDDLLVGLRWLEKEVAREGDPLLDLARAYVEQPSRSPVQHDPRTPAATRLVRRVRDSGAQAAIVAAPKMCEPGLDEQVASLEALEAAGIPHFVTEFEEGMTSFDHLQIQLETFVENILFA